MMDCQGRAIHVRGDESVRVECLVNGNAANELRNLARRFIKTTKHYMLGCSFQTRSPQDVGQPWPAETCSPYGPALPLNARHFGIVICTAVACAFDRIGD